MVNADTSPPARFSETHPLVHSILVTAVTKSLTDQVPHPPQDWWTQRWCGPAVFLKTHASPAHDQCSTIDGLWGWSWTSTGPLGSRPAPGSPVVKGVGWAWPAAGV